MKDVYNIPDLLANLSREKIPNNTNLLYKIKEEVIAVKDQIVDDMHMNFMEGENLILSHFDQLKGKINHLLDLAYKQYWNSITEINQTSLKEIESKMKKIRTLIKIQEISMDQNSKESLNKEELQAIAKYISKNKDKLSQTPDILQSKAKEIEDIIQFHNHQVKQFDSQKFKEHTDSICSLINKTFNLRESFQNLQYDSFNSHFLNHYENNESELRNTKSNEGEICSIRIINKQLVATAGSDPVIKIWNMQSGECITELEGHKDTVWCVLSAYEGKYLVSGSRDKTIKVWKLAEKKCKKTFRAHTKDVICLEYIKSQKILASGSLDSSIILWDMQQGKVSKTLLGHKGAVCSLKGLSDNETLLSCGDDSSIKIWDTRRSVCLKTLNGHKGVVFSMAIFNQEKNLITCSDDETIRVWNIEEGNCLQIIKAHDKGVKSLSINNSETLVVTGGYDHSLKVWDLQSLKLLRFQENNDTIIRSVQFYDEISILYGDKNLKVFKLNVV